MADFMIELQGTPEDVQEMLNKASRIEGATAFKKKRISEDVYHVWYRGKGAPNDLIAAIKKAAGLTAAKRSSRGRKKKTEEAPETMIMGGSLDGETFVEEELVIDGGTSPDSPKATA